MGLRTAQLKGQKTMGYSQPLALVDGDDLDGIGITLKAELVLLKLRGVGVPLPGKPFQEADPPEFLLRDFLVEHFREVKDIGKPPLPVGQSQKTGPDLLSEHEIPEHPDEAALFPEVVIFPESCEPDLPSGFVFSQAIERLSAYAHQIRCKGCLEQSFLVGFCNCRQYPLHLEGFVRFEKVSRAVKNAVDPGADQLLLDVPCLIIRPHKDCDIRLPEVVRAYAGLSSPDLIG